MKVMMDSPHLQPAFPQDIEQVAAQMPATPKRTKALRQLLDNARIEQPANAPRGVIGPRRKRGH